MESLTKSASTGIKAKSPDNEIVDKLSASDHADCKANIFLSITAEVLDQIHTIKEEINDDVGDSDDHLPVIIKDEIADVKVEEYFVSSSDIKEEIPDEIDDELEYDHENNYQITEHLHETEITVAENSTYLQPNTGLSQPRTFESLLIKTEESGGATLYDETKKYVCDKCPYGTNHRGNLQKHMETHAEERELKTCDQCNFVTISRIYFLQHKKTHAPDYKLFQCRHCNYQTKYRQTFVFHENTHKNPSELTMFKCGTCSYQTFRKYKLAVHEVRHKSKSEVQTFKCDSCEYVAKRKSHLAQHILRLHKKSSGPKVKNHNCTVCSYSTDRSDALKAHERIHCKAAADEIAQNSRSKLETFRCNMCPYTAKMKSHISQHITRVHSKSSQLRIKKHKCPFCSYTTDRPYILKKHLKTHNKIKTAIAVKVEIPK